MNTSVEHQFDPKNNGTNNKQSELLTTNLWKFGAPVLVLLGVTGNVCTVLVVHKLRSLQPSYLFIQSLAVINLVIVFDLLAKRWPQYAFDFDFEDINVVTCKLSKWIGYSSGMLSAFLMAAVSSCNAVTVVTHIKSNMQQLQKCKAINLALWFGVYLANFYLVFVRYHDGKVCRTLDYFDKNVEDYTHVAYLMLFSILPTVIIMASNGVLIKEVVGSATRMKAYQLRHRRQSRREAKVTVLVIATSVTFFILTFPAPVLRVSYQFKRSLQKSYNFKNIRDLLRFIWYINSVINFYVYLISGSDFRRAAMKIVCQATGHLELALTTLTRVTQSVFRRLNISCGILSTANSDSPDRTLRDAVMTDYISSQDHFSIEERTPEKGQEPEPTAKTSTVTIETPRSSQDVTMTDGNNRSGCTEIYIHFSNEERTPEQGQDPELTARTSSLTIATPRSSECGQDPLIPGCCDIDILATNKNVLGNARGSLVDDEAQDTTIVTETEC